MTDTHTTTHIPDEAVQAVASTIMVTHEEAYDVIKAILPYLSAPCAVEVMELEWMIHPDGTHESALTNSGELYIARKDGWKIGSIWFDIEGIENAKAAAQADFERRILSCVVTMPVAIPTKEERHANTARNLIINQTSADLENIINGHDPEQSILNNDVWDRLDKMACEIEALAKPVDVAAVRKQAFEEAAETAEKLDLVFDSKVGAHAADAIRALKGQQHDN